ncbi:unnamed protein product [Ectocarpus sp. CCAP 1310/34]|nr:unnamed protein product [Ectocarpus sp. CCAP 1310/34]
MALPRRLWADRPRQGSLHLLLLRYQDEVGMSVQEEQS